MIPTCGYIRRHGSRSGPGSDGHYRRLQQIRADRGRGRLSILKFHYLLGRPEGIKYFTEVDKFGLFRHSKYLAAFRSAGLKVKYDRKGLIGRGLYIGVKPTSISDC